MLWATDVTKNFDGFKALRGINLFVEPRGVHAIIGPNGAGKTTLFNLISGIYPLSGGRIVFLDKNITNLGPHRVARLGIARTFQNICLFPGMTVLENVMVGRHSYNEARLWSVFLRPPFYVLRSERAVKEKSEEMVDFVGLSDHSYSLAGSLPYGDQRRLEIARALATEPRLLLLDEPAAGMNPNETEQILQLMRRIRQNAITILLIEHDMKLVMGIADKMTVLNFGEKIAEGTSYEIRNNPQVIEAYLGTE
jgi:branched-chain amino acid transport system ATP-binding protein